MSSTLGMPQKEALTVTQLNTLVHDVFESVDVFSSIAVRGEISNLVKHRSGHFYFSLKDEGSLLRALMFRGDTVKLPFEPENGMNVILYGSLGSYVKDGSYRFVARQMEPDGIGALHLAFEQLKRRLAAEGLFDPEHKKPVPKIPTGIGIVTSPTGAAVRDLINVLGRRFPLARVILFPALVQGSGAHETLIEGVRVLDARPDIDLIIIGRGGGSMEDLWEFNNEDLARTIYAAKTPIISAVGHEIDFTICDFVSDLRAPTPSAAAELAVPETEVLKHRFDNVTDKLYSLFLGKATALRKRLALAAERPVFTDAEAYFRFPRQRLLYAREKLPRAMEQILLAKRGVLEKDCASLDALSPLSILSRGYAIASKDGRVLRRTEDVSVGEEFEVRVSDGVISAVCRDGGKEND